MSSYSRDDQPKHQAMRFILILALEISSVEMFLSAGGKERNPWPAEVVLAVVVLVAKLQVLLAVRLQ